MRNARRTLPLLFGLGVLLAQALRAQAPPSRPPAAPAAPAVPLPGEPRGAGPAGPARARGPCRHAEAAGHHEAPSRLRRPGRRRRAERRELRRGQGEPLPGLAGRPDPEGRPESHDPRDVVGEASPRDRGGLRARGLRPRAEGRAEGHVDGGRDRRDEGRRPPGRGAAGDRARGQLRSSRDHGRHPDGRGAAGPREGEGPGPGDVRLGQHARRARVAVPGHGGARRPALDRAARRLRLGLRVAQHRQHPGRQRRRPHRGHHRPREPGRAPHARAVGCFARVGLGRGPGARLPRDAARGRRPARGHRRGLALRQGRPRDHGLRAPLRGRAGGVVRRGRRQAAPPSLRGGGGEPRGIGGLPLDGRQLPEVRGRGSVVREEDRRRHPRRRAPAHRPVRAAPDLRQLRRPGEGRRPLAGPAGQLHGHGGGGPGLPPARGAGPRRDRGLPRGADAARQHGPPRRRARLAPARRRARGPHQHELLPRLGEPAAPPRAAPGSRRPAADARRPQLPPRPPAAPGQGERAAASTSTSWATPSRAAGGPPTTRTSWPTGRGPSTAGTPPTSAGEGTGRRTSCGAWRTASWTASTRRSSCSSPAPTTSAGSPATRPR